MGWASGVNAEGREVGYGIEATCDQDGCEKEIDRGLAYVCGAMHDGGDRGCGLYFCYPHLWHGLEDETFTEQLCEACMRLRGFWDEDDEAVATAAPDREDGS